MEEKKKSYKKILDDITCDTCKSDYCILKKIMLSCNHPDERNTLQIKCIDKLKYELSAIAGQNVGGKFTVDTWVNDGYAEAYNDVYKEGLSSSELYKLVKEKMKK
jgi:hypothetical protein